ncbi:MAG: DUF4965 domain-containing protein [Paenibacillaceae bacterium]|nr:DUF4965 domain-containing protein [Paenibacillaceae bacterium]
MSILYETMLGRLGSRFHLNFRPRERRIYSSPLGRFYDSPLRLSLGVKVGGETRILPFSDAHKSFAFVEQELTPTSVTFHCREPEWGIQATITFTAPFYPQEETVSTAPLYLIHASVENTNVRKLTGDAALAEDGGQLQGEIFLRLDDGERTPSGYRLPVAMTIDPALAELKWLHRTRGKDFSSGTYRGELAVEPLHPEQTNVREDGIHASFALASKQSASASFVMAGYTNEQVMNVEDELYRFRYTAAFSSAGDVIRYAGEAEAELLARSRSFDRIVAGATLDKAAANLIAFSLQSFLSNSWWMRSDGNDDWFTVWEGNCAYHSTIDVEYNASLFYLLLWPELLERTIRQWTRYEKEGGFMSHDIGKFLVGKGMEYGHEMEIEENGNFILLVHALEKFTGRTELTDSIYPQLLRLIRYIADSDTTGNGFPNKGTANTIDDAGAAVQYAKEQTYLGVKAYAAYQAMRMCAERMKDADTVRLCETKMGLIRDTLEQSAWLGDHYAVCIQTAADGVKDVWTGQQMEGEIPGWDAYSIYPSNGLLYLLMTATETGLNPDRLRTDLTHATAQSMTRYGCKHSSTDTTGNLWISQNLWKDFTAAYLGLDMLGLSDNYWDYELYENAQGIGGCFVDAPPTAHLNYYPRGVVSLGAINALGGVQVDKVRRVVHLNPVRVPCRVPLLSFADWKEGVVPWANFRLEQGQVVFELEEREQLQGFQLFVWGKETLPGAK